MKIQVKRLEKQVEIWMIPKMYWSLLLTRLSPKVLLKFLKRKGKKTNVMEEATTPPI